MNLFKPKTLCLYFELHQPLRLNLPDNFETQTSNLNINKEIEPASDFPSESFTQGPSGDNPEYLYGNATIFEKVATGSYLPGLTFWLNQIKRLPGLKLTLGLSGTFLEQLEKSSLAEPILDLIRQLLKTGRVEILAETYYHSLVSLLDEQEFVRQIEKHSQILTRLFDYQPTSFRNTELIFNPKIGQMVEKLGFQVQVISQPRKLLKSADQTAPNLAILGQNNFSNLGSYKTTKDSLKLALANFEATMFFFFTHRNEEFKEFFQNYPGKLEVLGTDFEIFGEHNGSHIFEIWTDLLTTLEPNWNFATVSDLSTWNFDSQNQDTDSANVQNDNLDKANQNNSGLHLPVYQEIFEEATTSWTNSSQSLVSWLGNANQDLAFEKLQNIYKKMRRIEQNKALIPEIWDFFGKLSTSDNFYYISDLPGDDGLLHAIFNAYPSPQIAFETYAQILDIFDQFLDNLSKD